MTHLEDFMHFVRSFLVGLVLLLALLACQGCATPKPPPGWPAGESRPINLPQARATR
jgi:hypothetical protein